MTSQCTRMVEMRRYKIDYIRKAKGGGSYCYVSEDPAGEWALVEEAPRHLIGISVEMNLKGEVRRFVLLDKANKGE